MTGTRITTMRTDMKMYSGDAGRFLRVLQSLDAFFPIGAFTLSNGLEDYTASECLKNSDDLRGYLQGFLQTLPYNDLGILALSCKYHGDRDRLLGLDHIAAAAKSAREVRGGTMRMCSRYIKAREGMKDLSGGLEWYRQRVAEKSAYGIYPVALGIYATDIGMETPDEIKRLLMMYAYSLLSAIVNNAVKLVPLSQMEGQCVLYETLDRLETLARTAMETKVSEIGIAGCANEIHCMRHERLYTRQYMS